ncbi:MAG: ComEC/Rec2 family competence protein [Chthoniobacterales bacterium]
MKELQAAIGTMRASFSKRRYPFVGLVGAAILGILSAYFLPVPAWPYALGATGFGAAMFVFRRTEFCLALTFCVLAAVFLWETRESPVEKFAKQFGEERAVVTLEGIVGNEPLIRENNISFIFRVSKIKTQVVEFQGACSVLVFSKKAPIGIGDRLEIVAAIQRIPRARNPGEFNARYWNWLRGIYFDVSVTNPMDIKVLSAGEGEWLTRQSLRVREWIMQTLVRGISNDVEVSSVLQTIVLGTVVGTSDATEEAFRRTGTYHLFSVSGLHVAMIATLLWYLARILRLKRGYAVIVIIPLLFAYAFLTGWQPSSVRAAMMACVVLIGLLVSRQSQVFNSLSGAAFLILLFNPRELFNHGFQLSFGVVASIVILAAPLQKIIRSKLQPDSFLPRQLVSEKERLIRAALCSVVGVICVSAAAWIGSFALTAGYFHGISLSSIPANLFAVPLAFIILALAMVSLLCGLVFPPLVSVFNNANWLFLKILLIGVDAFARIPGSYVNVGTPEWNPPLGEIQVLDLGAGGAAVLHAGGLTCLVDCGREGDAKRTVIPYLKTRGVSSLEWVALSHGDVKHIGGATLLLDTFPAGHIMDSGVDDRSRYHEIANRYLEEHQLPKRIVRPGDVVEIGKNTTAKILFPPLELQKGASDDKTLVLLFQIANRRILMMSDAGYATEQFLLESHADVKADILIIGRHFSGLNGNADFLAAVNPRIVIATAADYPASERLPEGFEERLQKTDSRLFRMDKTGAVHLRIFKDRYEVDTFLSDEHLTHRFHLAQ